MAFLKGYLTTIVFIASAVTVFLFVFQNLTKQENYERGLNVHYNVFYSDGFDSGVTQDFLKLEPLIIDVRTQNEFEQRHESDAVHIWLQDFQHSLNQIAKLENKNFNAPIIVYSNKGDRAKNAKKMLVSAGYKNVAAAGLTQKNQACCL